MNFALIMILYIFESMRVLYCFMSNVNKISYNITTTYFIISKKQFILNFYRSWITVNINFTRMGNLTRIWPRWPTTSIVNWVVVCQKSSYKLSLAIYSFSIFIQWVTVIHIVYCIVRPIISFLLLCWWNQIVHPWMSASILCVSNWSYKYWMC